MENNGQNTANNPDQSTDYTVQELLEMLAKDDSWEADPEYRMKAIGTLMGNVFLHC